MGAITFFDVETTGLSREDRIVTLGAFQIADESQLRSGDADAKAIYLIFNPNRPSHPRARKVHGFSDELLGGQDDFGDHLETIVSYFNHGGLAVAHNASFDRRFITNEVKRWGGPAPLVDFTCTMLMHREKHGPPSGLDPVLGQMGFAQRDAIHGALADAWFAMAAYCWLQNWPVPSLASLPAAGPLNLREGGAKRSLILPRAIPAPEPPIARVSDTYETALAFLRPLATLLVAVARADGEFLRAEIEVLSLLMHTTLVPQHALSDDEQQDLLAELVSLPSDDVSLSSAARGVVSNPPLRKIAGSWVRQITMADGQGSEAELAVIHRIAGLLRDAH